VKGVFGKILRIDLDDQIFFEQVIENSVYEAFLGGKGLASHLLLRFNPEGADPLSPKNHFILAVGPANGFSIWGANRYGAFTKSPLTGIF